MTSQLLVAGLLCVIGAITFTGILCWTLAREDEAFEERLRDAQSHQPVPTPAPSPEAQHSIAHTPGPDSFSLHTSP